MSETNFRYSLIEKHQPSAIKTVIDLASKKSSGVVKSVKLFFGLKTASTYKKSRIIRRYNKSFEEFVFKGYDQQTPGLFRPGSFKMLRMIGKN